MNENRWFTLYLTDSYIIFILKMESVSKHIIFGLKIMVKSVPKKYFEMREVILITEGGGISKRFFSRAFFTIIFRPKMVFLEYRFHFEGKHNVWVSQVRRVNSTWCGRNRFSGLMLSRYLKLRVLLAIYIEWALGVTYNIHSFFFLLTLVAHRQLG